MLLYIRCNLLGVLDRRAFCKSETSTHSSRSYPSKKARNTRKASWMVYCYNSPPVVPDLAVYSILPYSYIDETAKCIGPSTSTDQRFVLFNLYSVTFTHTLAIEPPLTENMAHCSASLVPIWAKKRTAARVRCAGHTLELLRTMP